MYNIFHKIIKYGFLPATLFLTGLQANSYELILPREKSSLTNSNYALFVGKTNNNETLMINNEHIFTASNGAFAHSVKLHEGLNRVLVRSGCGTQVYKFNKKTPTVSQPSQVLDCERQTVKVIKDGVPLRSTPVDAGLNRIAHLFKDTTLIIDGEKDGFYRVFLSKDKTAWISKKDVECTCPEYVASFVKMDSKTFKNAVVQNISFTKNLPYTIEEKNKEILFKVYNPEASENSVYTLNLPKPEKYFYNVYLEDGTYTFKVSELPDELRDVTVVIDAGHGGSENGALGCLGDKEKDVNLRIALALQEQLQDAGVNVVMTRECDGNVSLNDRVGIAKNNQAEIFVSIHLNSIGDVQMNNFKHKGTSVYYFNPNSKELAEILEKTVTKSAGTRKDGVRTASFAVIRPTEYVGVLIETAYMINPHDSVLYNSPEFARNVAKGITDGIVEFITK